MIENGKEDILSWVTANMLRIWFSLRKQYWVVPFIVRDTSIFPHFLRTYELYFILLFSCFWWQVVSTSWVLQKHQNYKICQDKYSTHSSQSKFREIWNANLLHIIILMRMKSSITATKMTGCRDMSYIYGQLWRYYQSNEVQMVNNWPNFIGDTKMTVFLLLS